MGFYVGDIPAADLFIEPSQLRQGLNLGDFAAEQTVVDLRNPYSEPVAWSPEVLFPDGGGIALQFGAESPFAIVGRYTLRVTLLGPGPHREAVRPQTIIVQGADGWHSLDSMRDEWGTGAPSRDGKLFTLLEIAKAQVVAAAPPLDPTKGVPESYRYAQFMQARNIWNASITDAGTGTEGGGDFVIRPYPLDRWILQVLRPSETPVAL